MNAHHARYEIIRSQDERLLEFRAAGLSLRELSEIDGRSITTIRRRLAESGRSGRLTEQERFWPKVAKTEACWLWTAGVDSFGYGMFRRQGNGAQERAHRVSFSWAKEAIPSDSLYKHQNRSVCA